MLDCRHTRCKAIYIQEKKLQDYVVFINLFGEGVITHIESYHELGASSFRKVLFEGTKYECNIFLKGFIRGQQSCEPPF